jgi:hypothetical protein
VLNEPSSLVGSVLVFVPIAEFAGKFETDHRRHAGQLNWQHAYHHFHNCDPKHNTPKRRFGASYYNKILSRTV